MFWITFILLVLLGLLGIASWLKSRQPSASDALSSLESVAGWIGIVGAVWALYLVSQLGMAMGAALQVAPISWIVSLVGALAMLGLGLVLAAPAVRQLAGEGKFSSQIKSMADVFSPYKIVLGFICLGFAAWNLVNAMRL